MKNQSQVNFFAQLYNITPYWMQNWLTSLKKVPTFFQWWLHPYGRKHTSSILAPYKNKYIGCRCVIIGNGPSLRKMDLSLLKNEFTFGLNRIYLLYDELGFETTFLVAVNRFVLDQFSNDLQKLPNLKILNWSYRKPFQINEKVIFLHPKIRRTTDGNILNGNYPGTGTVTNVALEIAFFMGFSEVILIGVDHSFVEKGTGNQAVVSSGADQNHFSPEYFGKGVVW